MSAVTFHDVVLVFPVAVAAHVAEEWPRFPQWARRWASPLYSDREYVVTHVLAVTIACAAALTMHWYSAPWTAFTFFALIFGPATLCNAVFHLGASMRTRTYCPGAFTALLLYIPLAMLLAWRAAAEGLLLERQLAIALIVAAVFHTAEVSRNVFKRW